MDDMPSQGQLPQEGMAPPPAVVKNWLRTNFSQTQNDPENMVIVRQAISAFKGLLKNQEDFGFHVEELPKDMQDMLEKRGSWEFNVFEYVKSAGGSEKLGAVALMHKIFEDWGFFDKFQVKPFRLKRFVETVVDHYHENPYHCATHVLDVTQTIHVMLKSGLKDWLNDLQRLGLIVAGFVHDLEHDGLSNIYHVKTFSARALAHNDVSPQENHHLVTAFSLMKRRDLGIFNELDPPSFSVVRGVIVRAVLFSDMSQHFKLLENFKTLSEEKGDSPSSYDSKDIELVCSLALHAADISNPAKTFELAKKWTQKVMTEFMNQGDKEREKNFPISPMCDRFQPAVPDSQCGFIKYVVKPTFVFLNKLVPELTSPLEHLDKNIAVWEGLRAKSLEDLEEMEVMPKDYKEKTAILREKLARQDSFSSSPSSSSATSSSSPSSSSSSSSS